MERLAHEGEGILLIFDNAVDADALKPYLPRGGAARVLVTSNAHAWRGVAAPVEIRLWPKEIGADYLIARTGRTAERAAALALSEALGGLPLAHEQAAAYCERLDLPLAEYAKRFAATPARLLDDARHAPAEYHDGLTVAKTFALAIDEAAKLHPAAEPLIVHAALLAPEPIPLFLFSQGREKFGEPLASVLEGDGLDEAVAALRDVRAGRPGDGCRRARPHDHHRHASACTGWCARSRRHDARARHGRVRGAYWWRRWWRSIRRDIWRDPHAWPRVPAARCASHSLSSGDDATAAERG